MKSFILHPSSLILSLCLCASLVQAAPRSAIYSLAFSPDGKRLAIGTHREALVYDTSNWTVVESFTRIENAVRAVAFHPDGKHIALGSGIAGVSGDLQLEELGGPEKVREYPLAKDTIESIAFAKDGSSMLTASYDSKARFYPKTFFGNSAKLEEHNGRVTAVAFSPKPNYIFVTGAMDKMAKVWDYKKANVVVNFDQATGGITGLGFLSNGDQLVGASLDGNLYWWGVSYDEKKRIYSGYNIRAVHAHDGGVTAFGVSADYQRAVTGGMDHVVRVWKMDDGGQVREFKEPTLPVYCAALSPDGKIAAAGGRDGVVWVWDVEANKLLSTLFPPPARIPAGAILAKRPQ